MKEEPKILVGVIVTLRDVQESVDWEEMIRVLEIQIGKGRQSMRDRDQ